MRAYLVFRSFWPGNFRPKIYENFQEISMKISPPDLRNLEISNFLAGGQFLGYNFNFHQPPTYLVTMSACSPQSLLIYVFDLQGGTIDFLVSPLPDNFANCSSALWSNYTRRNPSCKHTNLIIITTTHNDCRQCCCGWFCRLREVPLPPMYVCF